MAHRERLHEAQQIERFSNVLQRFISARIAYYARQRETADDFNLLDVLQLISKEVRHSMMLAWLLDCDAGRLGSHAQGNLGLRLFLEELGLPTCYADAPYYVRREVAGDDAIVDVEVVRPGDFLIHIENKIWSTEGTDQTDREWADLCRRAASFGLDPHGDSTTVHALYLTPTGVRPSNPNFRPISWKQIIRVLRRFAEQAQAPQVRLFASHYATGLQRFVVESVGD